MHIYIHTQIQVCNNVCMYAWTYVCTHTLLFATHATHSHLLHDPNNAHTHTHTHTACFGSSGNRSCAYPSRARDSIS